MTNHDGYSLWNSDTALGRALRKHFHSKVISLRIDINANDPVTIRSLGLLPDEFESVDWNEVFANAVKDDSRILRFVNPLTGRATEITLTDEQVRIIFGKLCHKGVTDPKRSKEE